MIDTKLLRQKILDLAIRGKLVPQDPNDEPASVLLEKIRAEKASLAKEGKIKKDKIESFIYKDSDNRHYENVDGKITDIEEEIPFEVPKGWAWARLNNLAFYKKGPFGSSITKDMFIPDTPNAVKVYEQKNAIKKDHLLGNYFISVERFEQLKGFEVFPDDVIVSCAGTIGETYIMPSEMRKGIINQALMRIKIFESKMMSFYLMYFDFILKREANILSAGTAMNNIPPFEILKSFLMPIPPLAEQARINSMVDKFDIFLLNIENQQKDFINITSIAKSKILDLAVRGKLVPQDPNDEPASVLLERIRAEKAVSDKGKKGRVSSDKYHYQRVVSDEQELFDLPDSWCWCRLGDIVSIIGGVSYDKRDISNEGIRILRGGNIQNGIVIFADDDVFLPSKYTNSENTIYKDDIIIVASTGSETVIGKAGFIHKDFHNVQIGAFLRIIRPKFSWLSGYLNLIFKSKFYTKYIRNKAKGTNINNIKTNYLTDFFIPLPPIAEQNRIDKIVNRLLDKITYMSEQ